jgi:predicted O-methyltransferase YrrM
MAIMKSKAANLISLLPKRPIEFCERVVDFAHGRLEPVIRTRPEYEAVALEDGLSAILAEQNAELSEILAEDALASVEEQVLQRQAALPMNAPFSRSHNGDRWLGRLCYAITRSLRPTIVAETGVCYGVTSAYLLAALEANGEGQLHSIDLPPLGEDGDAYVGWLVSSHLRRRWSLRRGASARLLRPLLSEVGPIDLFVHDSLHTYKNMKNEFEAAWPALRDGGVLISDDIEGNQAFLELTRSEKPRLSVAIKEKDKGALFGVAVKSK